MQNEINKKLKGKAIEKFGSQFVFAGAVQCRESFVSAVIRGKQKLSPEQLVKWSAALGTDVKKLLQ